MDLFEKLTKDRVDDWRVFYKINNRRIWDQIVDKYSDQAHFLYELLQNADDALATETSFELYEHGLVFRHNGRVRFSLSDVEKEEENTIAGKLGHINSITATNSSKTESNKIGKFGVGFKAVFQYTLTPHIYDDVFRFKIENFIIPRKLDSDHPDRLMGETLFYFPFNHDKKSKVNAYNEIAGKLKTLIYPVLFLYQLKTLKWKTVNETGYYSKEILRNLNQEGIKGEFIRIRNSASEKFPEETLWLFSKKISADPAFTYHKISAGFFITPDGRVETGNEYDAYCFFKTKESTHLGFLVQAPFLLTDSREGIKAGENWNRMLVQQLADLSAESLLMLKDFGVESGTRIIDDSVLEIIPTNPDLYPEESNSNKISFKPFYEKLLSLFQKEKMLPGLYGKYYRSEKSYWASEPDLIEIFSDQQISYLMNNPESGWVFTEKGHKNIHQTNKNLAAYISGCVTEIIDAKKIIRRINSEFIESQTDEWLMKFYGYLVDRQYLWNDKDKIVQKRSIILNQDRKAVLPVDDFGNCTVFLPPDRKTSYDTVYPVFLNDEKSKDFFKCIGIKKPDKKTELYLSIIPQYRNMDFHPDDDTLKLHFVSFLEYYQSCPLASKNEFIKDLSVICFLIARKKSQEHDYFLKRPEELYLKTPELEIFFEGYDEVYYFDQNFYEEILDDELRVSLNDFLTDIGVKQSPKLNEIHPELTTDIRSKFKLDTLLMSMKHWNQQSLRDLFVEGLENAISSINQEKSLFIWNWLINFSKKHSFLPLDKHFQAVFTYVQRGKRSFTTHYLDSSVKKLLLESAWLFDNSGNIFSPSGITAAKLSAVYDTESNDSVSILKFLGLYSPEASLNLSDEQKTALTLGRKLIEQNISQQELDEIISIIRTRQNQESSLGKVAPDNGNVEDELEKVLGNIRKEIRKKREDLFSDKNGKNKTSSDGKTEEAFDSDELLKSSVDFQKEIEKLKNKVQSDIEEITQKQKLTEELKTVQKYSYRWFIILLQLEHLGSYEFRSGNKSITITFSKVVSDKTFPGILIFSNPSRFIPSSVSEAENVNVKMVLVSGSRNLKLEVINATDYMLRAKVTSDILLTEDDLNSLISTQININNPVFILEELINAYRGLCLDNSFNMRDNLTDKIKFIFGPPGTGKTTHLVEKEIIPIMKSGKNLKVLVLTPTNKAADVLSRILIDKSGEDFSYYEWFFRYGITGDATIENAGILVTRNTEYLRRPKMTLVTTIARFAYDYITEGADDSTIRLCEEEWDVIIFDEASMIPIAYTLLPVYMLRNTEFIVAGDPFQIQPIVIAEDWKDENIYTLVNLDTFNDPETFPHRYPVVKLTTQYRSVPSIGDLFSNFTYGGELTHFRGAADNSTLDIGGLILKDINIINFPVNSYHNLYKPNFLNGSSYHIYSALLTVELTEYILRFVDEKEHNIRSLGIICPYRAQADLIRKIVESKKLDSGKTEVTAGTIHGFQGDECDLIITVLNPRKCSDPSRIFLNNKNIINVSISRARNNLVIIMPGPDEDGISQLNLVERLRDMIESMEVEKRMIYSAKETEQIISGERGFIEDNSCTDSHQSVNVYSSALKKYEIRYEDTAVDIQVSDNHHEEI